MKKANVAVIEDETNIAKLYSKIIQEAFIKKSEVVNVDA